MSGHSKWSQIKRQKAVADAEKSRAYSKIAKVITIASREGANPDFNPKLKSAIEKARSLGAPKDLIERAINKAAAKGENRLEEVIYGAYGPAGSVFIISAITDNKNRTNQEIRQLLENNGAKMVNLTGVAHLFEKADSDFQPKNKISITNEQDLNRLKTLLNIISEHEDVQEIYSNLEKSYNFAS